MAITRVTRNLLSTGIDDQSNATAITIDSSENVGIGLTNQANKLQVDGDICIGKATTSADLKSTLKMRGANGSNELQVFDLINDGENGRVDFKYNRAGNAAQTIMSFGATVGNVGIGTTSPSQKLDVQGTAMMERSRLSTNDGTTYWDLRRDSSTGHFVISDDGLGDVVTIKQDTGNVGIGTTSPSFKLHVGGGIGANSATAYASMTGRIGFGNDYSDTQRGPNKIVLQNDGSFISGFGISNGSTDLYTGGAFNFVKGTSPMMTIDSSGRLLVGTTSVLQADNKVTVSGSGTGAGSAIMDIRNTSSNDNCGVLSLSKATTTTSSANRFIYFYTNNFGTGMGAIAGNGATNVQFVSASDERLKENIKPLTGSLDKVLALNPVSYTWKENGDHIKAGFIAQEVEKVLPEYTDTEDDEMKTKSITGGMTAGYIAVLTKAIQEQQTIIEDLKTRIKTLENV